MEKTKLSKRLPKQENYYLNLVEGSTVAICDEKGYIIGSVHMKNGKVILTRNGE